MGICLSSHAIEPTVRQVLPSGSDKLSSVHQVFGNGHSGARLQWFSIIANLTHLIKKREIKKM